MQVSNLWGGLIYLLAPSNTKVEGAEVVVQIAMPAPYYKSGECVSLMLHKGVRGESNGHRAIVMSLIVVSSV